MLHARLIEESAADGACCMSASTSTSSIPTLAPGVGTTVPGGATYREAHLVMEMLHDSGLVGSLDIVELNPFLDERGKSARSLAELVASLFGRTILDRPAQRRVAPPERREYDTMTRRPPISSRSSTGSAPTTTSRSTWC